MTTTATAVANSLALRPSELQALLAKCIPAHESVLITGAPGIGKTSIVEQATVAAMKTLGLIGNVLDLTKMLTDAYEKFLLVMHPVVSDPTDFKGMPAVVDGLARFLPFGDLNRLINATELLVCFLDDLGQAPPAVQAAAMQLLLARRINGHKISSHVVFLAATNRRQDRAGVSGILEPVKSRFTTIVELMAHVGDWKVWAAGAGIRPEVITWMSVSDAKLSDFKPTAEMTNSASPRGWHAVSRILNLGLSPRLQMVSIAGAVGEEQAVGFTAFLRVWQAMISPQTVLTSPDTAPIPSEPSALYALMGGLADQVRVPSMPRYCRYMERLYGAQKGEFIAASVPVATARDESLKSTAAYTQMMSGPVGQLFLGAE